MRLTLRDHRLIRDMALSHVLSRDQVIALRYFSSVTRANTRLRELRSLGLVRRIETPFFGQALYSVGPKAKEVLGERIGQIVAGRTGSPRFLQHAISVTFVRIALIDRGATAWRFEQQLRSTFEYFGRTYEVRPDGMVIGCSGLIAIEVDLGHVAPTKFKAKLDAYEAFVRCGEAKRQWHHDSFKLLTITTGPLRASRLKRLVPRDCPNEFAFMTFDQLGLPKVGSWS